MSGRFYLSTRIDRIAEAEPLLKALANRGWERTFVWTDGEVADEERPTLALAELAGIREADIVIVLLPGGRGTHVELGAALALGKRVILHSPNRETLSKPYPCVFHYHPAVSLFISEVVDVDAILTCITTSK
jgi:nucleoside 2-deoxyribosyltransferase